MTSARRPRSERWGSSTDDDNNNIIMIDDDHDERRTSMECLLPDRPISVRGGTNRRNNSTPTASTSNSITKSSPSSSSTPKQRSLSNPDEVNLARARNKLQQSKRLTAKLTNNNNNNNHPTIPESPDLKSPSGRSSTTSSTMDSLSNQLGGLPTIASGSSQQQQDARSCDRSTMSKTSRRQGSTTSSSSSTSTTLMRSYKKPISGNDSVSTTTSSAVSRTLRGQRRSATTSTTSRSGDCNNNYSDARSNGSLRRSRTSSGSTGQSSSHGRRDRSRDDERKKNDNHESSSHSRSRSQSRNGRSRSSSAGPRSRSKSRNHRSKSRTRSKSAKRRSGGGNRRISGASSVTNSVSLNGGDGDAADAASHQPQDAASLTSRSRIRRKPADRTNLGASSASLDPSIRSSMESRSVGSGGPSVRRTVARSMTTTMVKVKRRSKSPKRVVVRSKSSDSSVTPNTNNLSNSGPIGLANFLQMAGKKNPPTKSSGRSVTSMPIPKSELSVCGGSVSNKLSSRRGKKGEPVRGVARSGSGTKHHGSFTSGLDFLTATASVSSKPTKKSKTQQRMNSSLGSGLDFLTAAKDELESTKKKGRRIKKPTDTNDDPEPSLHISDLLGETVELDEDDSSTASTSDVDDAGSVCTMGTIADRRKQFEQELKRNGISESDVFQGDAQEDIFTFYSWSSSKQTRPKILRERNLLQDALQQPALIKVKQQFINTT
ncbi:hypothetical protein IV203_025253 [Nitzschia inconspicua]|uniref:Uncharacterized protein n=1 Tax=Nitzschia inconspicua TaxID=303405 RepID=A0A9K3PZ11_9STRA|nr:hypothetical protein IV203_024741 [Nitzschia inconspicua]KAG7362369.1 hypothetical protein IV203_025253 [Nitzschia inconspicua]